MSAEITVGSVLGGRYLVTAEVVTTAEGDFVFDGTDQVLNRPVSLLVAAPSNATRVAVSAREIAMGTRPSDVQVLDLGLNANSTYLIANLIDPASLLDLVVEPDAPYIEPFQTDTLGQEIFGEPRSLEPEVYEDDAEYYQELAEEQQRRPLFGRLFGKRDEGEPQDATAPTPVVPEPGAPAPVADAGNAAPLTGPFASAPQAAGDAAAVRRRVDASSSDAAAGASPASAPSPVDDATAPFSALPSASTPSPEDATRPSAVVSPQTPAVTELPPVQAPQQRATLSSDEDAARDAAARGDAARAASRFPQAAVTPVQAPSDPAAPRSAEQAAVVAAADDVLAKAPRQRPREDSDTNRWTRLLVGLVLVVVLVGGVVVAVKALGGGGQTQTAEPTAPTATGSSEPSTPQSTDSTPQAAPPAIADLDFAAPSASEMSNLVSSSGSPISAAIDGKSSTGFATYSYKTPNFGNFFKQFTLRIKLEKATDINAVTMSGLGGTGGEVQVSVGDSPNASSAKDVWSGSFSGATLEAPTVNGGVAAKGSYVFITVSELPRLASPASADRPYGFQVSEIKVS